MRELIDVGLWAEKRTSKSFKGRPAIFLDRDGVVINEKHFLKTADGVELTPGIGSAIAAANRANYAVILITNQSGIARGYLTWQDFSIVQNRLIELLSDEDAKIDLVLACGFHRDGIGELARDHIWRKPSPGMLLEAERQLQVGLPSSFIVGDRITDIAAGLAAGLRHAAMVHTGYGETHWQRYADQINAWRQNNEIDVADRQNGAESIFTYLKNTQMLS